MNVRDTPIALWAAALALGLLWLTSSLLVSTAYAATINTVQSGTATSAGTGTVSVPLAPAVNPAQSFVIFQSRHNLNRPPGSMIRGTINAAGTAVDFTRVTNEASTMEIQWYVAEFTSGVSVQRGQINQTAATLNIGIPQGFTGVSSLSQAFVTWSKTPTATDGDWSNDDPVLCELTSTTNLQCRVLGVNVNHVIAWQVIEFTNAADIGVQSGSVGPGAMTGATNLVTVPLATPVNVNTSFALVGYTTIGGGADVGERMLRAQLQDANTLLIDRSITGDTIDEIGWQVIDLRDGSTVQRGSESFPSAASTQQVVVTTTGPVNAVNAGAITMTDAEGGVPEATVANAMPPAGNPITTNISTLTNNAVVVDVVGSGNGGSFLPGAGQTVHWDISAGSATGAMSTKLVSPTGLTSMTQTHTGPNRMAHALIAVAPAGASPIGVATISSASDTDGNNTMSFAHAPGAGSNRKLVVAVAIEDGSPVQAVVTNVTYGGAPLTFAAAVTTPTGFIQRVEIWYLDEVDFGQPVVVTTTGAVNEINAGAITLTDAAGGVPEATVTNTMPLAGDPITTNITTLTNNAVVVDVVGSGNAGSFLPGAAQTEHWDTSAASGTGAMSSKLVSPPGLTSMTQDHSGPNRMAHALIAVAPAGASPIGVATVSSAGDTDGNNTMTFSHAPGAGSNRKLVVAVAIEDGSAAQAVVTGVTYGGTSMTFAGAITTPTGFIQRVEIWYLDEANFPVVGGSLTRNVSITPIDTTRSIAFGSVQPVGGQNMGRSNYIGDDVIGVGSFTAALSASQLTLQRSTDVADADVGWFVVEFTISFDHYAISFPSGTPGLTCEPSVVRITAHDSSDVSFNAPAGTLLTITTSTGSGVWEPVPPAVLPDVGTGTWGSSGLNDGMATYTWPGAESFFEVRLRHSAAVAGLNINLLDSLGNTESNLVPAEDPSIDFVDTAFRVTDAVPNPAAIGTQIAAKDSDTGFGSQALFLQAIRTDTNTGSCVGVFQSQTQTVELASECNDPSACEGGPGSAMTVDDNTGTPVAIGVNDAGLPSDNYVGVALDFDVDSKAPLTINYLDAGRVTLHSRFQFPPPPPSTFMTGASNAFVVRPFALSTESGDPNFNATDATGTAFKKAGENFDVTVRAVLWESGDDLDNDGIPDGGADLTNNGVTPNFGQEAAAATVDITHALVLPSVPGDTGTLSGGAGVGGFGSVLPGETTATLAFDEVGIMDLTADLLNYLGDPSADATGTASDVGRFYPDRFVVTDNGPAFVDECTAGVNPFTYQDQDFHYSTAPVLTVTAVNDAGATTENYGGGTAGPEGFWKLSSTLPRTYIDQAGAAALFADVQDTDVTLAGELDFDGMGTLALDSGTAGDALMYTRVSEEGEFAANVDLGFAVAGLTDTDSVCYDPDNNDVCDAYTNIMAMTGAMLRFGRLVIGTAGGSELLPLNVPLQAQYFDGTSTAFIVNTDDACTGLAATTDLILNSAVEAGQTDGDVDITNASSCGGTGVATATIANDPMVSGAAGLSFSVAAPAAGCTGFADITTDLTTLGFPYLLYDWDGDGNFDNDPTGRASFGIFRGAKEIIYIREPWD